MVVIGIDVGVNGGICYRTKDELIIEKMTTEKALHDRIQEVKGDDFAIVFIEEITMQLNHAKGRRMINNVSKVFGQYNRIIAGLELLNVTYVKVHPRRWTSALKKLGVRPQSFKNPKNAYKDFAQRLYPDQIKKITLSTADAVCLCWYGFQTMKSQPKWMLEKTQKNGRDF